MSSAYRVFNEERYAYFITSTIVEWLPVFVSQPYFDIVIESLNFIRAHKGVQVNVFVIMPTHLHLVVYPDANVKLTDVMRDFKRFTSRAISTQLEQDEQPTILRGFAKQAPDRAKAEYRVWQEGFHPEAIYTPSFAQQKIEYLHNNPVRKGLVDAPEQWRYSSARNYLLNDESGMEIDRLEF